MEMNISIINRFDELENRIAMLENTLKANNIEIPNKESNQVFKDDYYPFTLRCLNQIEYGDRWGGWKENQFEMIYFPNGDVNGFETEEDAINYVRTHLDIFPMKVYIYNEETGKARKVKKHN